jgi:phosphate transport system substrate-binding protein
VTLVSYQIACTNYDDAAKAKLVKGLYDYIISAEGQDAAAKNAGSAPISDTLRQQIQPAVVAIGAGS